MAADEVRPEFKLHFLAIELACECAARSASKYDSAENDIVRDALFSLSRDAVVVHRSVACLVVNGWSPSAAILVRTLLDVQVSMLAIIRSKDPKLAAFRYFYSTYRAIDRASEKYDAAFRQNARNTIRSRIAQLPLNDRPSAYAFLRQKDRPYWFYDEFKSPSDVINRFGSDGVLDVYRQLSAAAHAGFFGFRLFSDVPDDRGVNPILPIRDNAVSLALISSRQVVETVLLRSDYEDLDMSSECRDLRATIIEAANALKVASAAPVNDSESSPE